MTNTMVTTYADGTGRWYARVDFTSPVGPDWLERNIDSIRQKARRAIRTEIKARQAARPGLTRVEVAADLWRHGQSPDHMNQWWSITYREKD